MITIWHAISRSMVGLSIVLGTTAIAVAQEPGNPIQFKVEKPTQRLEMVINSSRILTLDKDVPRALVNNTEIVRVVPLSPKQVQISATRTGVTQVNLWDNEGNVYTVDVFVVGDAQELQMLLQTEFPQAALRVRPMASSVLISGFVDRPEMVQRIVTLAEDYYPKVINNITVGGVQQVLLHVKVLEVSRTKLRTLGFDWANFGNSDFVVQSVSGIISSVSQSAGTVTSSGGETVAFGLIGPDNSFFGFVEALRENNLAKILAEPTLVTVSGRPASFNSGGEFPILVPQSLGTISVTYKEFGTRVDFVPIVLGNGNIRLEVRPQISELDNASGVTLNGNRVPGLRTRWVDTGVEMRVGQTLALAGLIQTRTESQNRGLPWLADIPWAGAAFRKVSERQNEVELLVMVRPELVDALDPHEVPPCGPGEQTDNPNDVELYFRGYLEVPKCCPDGSCPRCQGQVPGGPGWEGQGVPVLGEPVDPASDPAAAEPANSPSDGAVESAQRAGYRHSRVAAGLRNRTSVPARPVATRRQFPQGSHNVNPNSPLEDPGLFGGVGYDELDYKVSR